MQTPWAEALAAIASGDTASFHAAVAPLAVATKLSYTSTHGSYFNASEAHASIGPGWTRDPIDADPPSGAGMRAVVFVEAADTGAGGGNTGIATGQRGVIAYRGTDLNASAPSGAADACADALLFGGQLPSQLPASCSRFNHRELDYYGSALAFARSALERHPGVQFVLTGHSLGAGLASVVAGALGAPTAAVVFASPPAADLYTRLVGKTPAALGVGDRVTVLGGAVDPVFYESRSLGALPGRVCVWDGAGEGEGEGEGTGAVAPPAACATCFEGQPGFLHRNAAACDECFASEHVFSHYLYDLVPGPRPWCGAPSAGPAFPQPTLRAKRGATPRIDGVLSPGEWDDAFCVLATALPDVQQFSEVTDPVDWSLDACWLKFDDDALYIGVDVTDDVAYGVDTPSWQPAANPDARLLNRSGWPWFGDEMEVLVNARPSASASSQAGQSGVKGNASQWQMVVNTVKSRLGGYGVGGLMEGEPRSDNGTAWRVYREWIETGVMRAATRPRPRGGGARRGYVIEWRIGFAALSLPGGKPFDPRAAAEDVRVGINLAFGDVDTPGVGDPKFGLRHETWISGQKDNRTRLDQFATLWLLV